MSKSTRVGRDPIHCSTEYFQARWVGPMRVIEDHEDRTFK